MDDVAALVDAALDGNERAWAELVDRYSGLVWAIARNHRLSISDASDVTQTVWLKLVEHLGRISDPRRLPGWLSTTTRRECMRVLRLGQREQASPDGPWMEQAPGARPGQPEAEAMADARDEALWLALSRLDEPCRSLLRLLTTDPPLSYEEISQVLGMRIGSIGPTRGRCLERLRAAIADFGINEDALRSV